MSCPEIRNFIKPVVYPVWPRHSRRHFLLRVMSPRSVCFQSLEKRQGTCEDSLLSQQNYHSCCSRCTLVKQGHARGALSRPCKTHVILFACYSDCYGLQHESKCDLDAQFLSQWRKNGTESCKKCMSACQVAALTPCAARWHCTRAFCITMTRTFLQTTGLWSWGFTAEKLNYVQ